MDYSRVCHVVKKGIRVAGILSLFFISQQSIAAVSDWFATQVNTDGSISSAIDVAAPMQSTSEVLRTYKQLGLLSQPEVSNALQFIGSESYNNTETLSRKIIALNDAGQATALLITELLGMQNYDGGWGELLGYDSSAMDTAFGLSVLAELNVPASEQVQSAIIYLLGTQKSDGGWSGGVNASSVYETSLVINALSYYKSKYVGVNEAISSATSFLFSTQNASNLWGSTLDSSHALLALTQTLSDVSVLKTSISTLEQQMLLNTSWDNDVYITAIVTRLISIYQKRLATPPQNITNGGITGEVVLAGSAEPVSGVKVSIKELGGSSVVTNSLGVFASPSIKGGTYTLVFSKVGLISVSAIVMVKQGVVSNIGKIALNIAPTTGILTGNIFDSTTQVVIPNAQVSLSGAQNVLTNTNQVGEFNVSNLTPGSYTYVISATGYNTISASFTVTSGQTLLLKQGLTKEGAFLDSSPADLFGIIVDGNTGKALVGATVNLSGTQQVATNASG